MSEEIGDPGLELLYGYWRRKRGERALPRRADIDPTEIPGKLWPTLMLLDVVRDSQTVRFRYRVTGTAFTHAFGRDPTHEFIDEALPTRSGYRDYVVRLYLDLVALKCPIYSENLFALDGQAVPMVTKRLSLPLSSDGETVDVTLASHVYDYNRLPGEGYMAQNTGFRELRRIVLND